eukprot:5175850-Pleurochrysis_carterae.AAC.1
MCGARADRTCAEHVRTCATGARADSGTAAGWEGARGESEAGRAGGWGTPDVIRRETCGGEAPACHPPRQWG